MAETGNAQSDKSGETAATVPTSAVVEADGSGGNIVVQEPAVTTSLPDDLKHLEVVQNVMVVPATPPVTPLSSGDEPPPVFAPVSIQPVVSSELQAPHQIAPPTTECPDSSVTPAPVQPSPVALEVARIVAEVASLVEEVAPIIREVAPTVAAPTSIDFEVAPVVPVAVTPVADATQEAPKAASPPNLAAVANAPLSDTTTCTTPTSNGTSRDVKDQEIEILRARVKTLETELAAALTRPGAKNHEIVENIKEQHEELLSKARGMIFDKTKLVKNQELQIAALTSQVSSLKDVNTITKDLLEIRNAEVKHLEERLQTMEARFKAEKERHLLVLKKTETGSSLNNDLKKEYETQLTLFKELRQRYEQRVQALVAENKRLAESVASGEGTASAATAAAAEGSPDASTAQP